MGQSCKHRLRALLFNRFYAFQPGVALSAHLGGGLVGAALMASPLLVPWRTSLTGDPQTGLAKLPSSRVVSLLAGVCALMLAGAPVLAFLDGQPWRLSAPPRLVEIAVPGQHQTLGTLEGAGLRTEETVSLNVRTVEAERPQTEDAAPTVVATPKGTDREREETGLANGPHWFSGEVGAQSLLVAMTVIPLSGPVPAVEASANIAALARGLQLEPPLHRKEVGGWPTAYKEEKYPHNAMVTTWVTGRGDRGVKFSLTRMPELPVSWGGRRCRSWPA